MKKKFKIALSSLAFTTVLSISSFANATPSGEDCTWQLVSSGGGVSGFRNIYTAVGSCVHSTRVIEGGYKGPGGSWIVWFTYY